MFGPKIWDFYAGWYDKLWVQKFVLTPSRQLILKTISELPKPENILDVGCGIGELCVEISQKYPSAEITGIDPSSKMIERANQSFSSQNIKYICGNPENLPKNQQFDLIVSTNAFPYVEDKPKFLSELKKRLKPGGRILLLFSNKNNFYDACWLAMIKLTTSKAQYLSVKATQQLLEKQGFKIGKTERIDSVFFVPSVYMIEAILPKNLI